MTLKSNVVPTLSVFEHLSVGSRMDRVDNVRVPRGWMKEMFYLTTYSTHFIYGYMASDIMVKDRSNSERGNPLPPHGLLFPISSKCSFICIILQKG